MSMNIFQKTEPTKIERNFPPFIKEKLKSNWEVNISGKKNEIVSGKFTEGAILDAELSKLANN